MQIKSYESAVKYLESFIGKVRFEITPEFLKHHDPLERMRVLLGFLGNPQEKFKSVLIGGTSGKGSTAYLISHILITAGYKTGLTISPHLQKINERIQINCKEISDKKFTEMVSSLVQTIELMGKMKVGEPSYFEILIAMAFLYFVQEKVDIAVVEVGMGGEFDATNTLSPLIAVLTNVGLDHTNVLGKSVEKIARTKAGIIKSSRDPVATGAEVAYKNSLVRSSQVNISQGAQLQTGENFVSSPRQNLVVVSGVKQPSVIKIVEDKRKEVGAKFFRLGKDFNFEIKKESLEGSVFDLTVSSGRGLQLNGLDLSLLGEYQVENTSIAIKTVLELEKFGFKVSDKEIRRAVSTAFFPGRFEIITAGPVGSLPATPVKQASSVAPLVRSSGATRSIILDGAHNPTKMKAFLATLKKLYPKEKKIFLVAFKNDKDIPKMLKQILKVADCIIVTEFRTKTDMSIAASASIESIAKDIKILRYKDTKIKVEKDSKKALEEAHNILISKYPNIPSVIVVTGSLYLVGEVKDML